jgi:hypothetical protein
VLEPFDGPQQTLYYVGSADRCDEANGEGWYYDDPAAPSHILLCEGTCDQTFGARLTINFGCPYEVP